MREYSVAYTTKDGERKMETMSGSGHREIERRIAALGGTVLSLERADDDEDYSRKARKSIRRTVGCATIVILAVAGAVLLFWLRTHR